MGIRLVVFKVNTALQTEFIDSVFMGPERQLYTPAKTAREGSIVLAGMFGLRTICGAGHAHLPLKEEVLIVPLGAATGNYGIATDITAGALPPNVWEDREAIFPAEFGRNFAVVYDGTMDQEVVLVHGIAPTVSELECETSLVCL